MPKKQLRPGFSFDYGAESSSSEEKESEPTEDSFYSTSSASSVKLPPSRQQRMFDVCCRNSFNAGKSRTMPEERLSLIDGITSSDETVKSSSVILMPNKEAWRTTADHAWLLLDLGNLCHIWGVVISWWSNCCADRVTLTYAVDKTGDYWNLISGTQEDRHLTFDKVTRIDFPRAPTHQLRVELRGGHKDFLMKRFMIGIRQIEVLGCRANILEDLWQPAERPLVEEGLRKVDRENKEALASYLSGLHKKLYMPGEAMKDALDSMKEGQVPPWTLLNESGILTQNRCWPGTKERKRLQTPAEHRWTELDPAHPFYMMSPRERRKMQHLQELAMAEEDEQQDQDDFYEEWDQQTESGPQTRSQTPASTRPTSASTRPASALTRPGSALTRPGSAQSRPSSAFGYRRRPSTPLKYGAHSSPSTRPTTAGGTRPTTPDIYGSRGGTRPSTPGLYASGGRSRPASSSAYAARFGDSRPSTPSRPGASGVRPSTAGPSRPASSGVDASQPSTAGKLRPSTAGKQRPELTFADIPDMPDETELSVDKR